MSDPRDDVIKELHKPARRNYNRRRTIVYGIDDLWQGDLAEYQKFAKFNKGFKFILVVIDCFSKFLWTVPLKDKSAQSVKDGMQLILRGKRQPKNFQTDNGKEFYNKQFKDLMNKHNINHYSTFSTIKASMAERVIRTLKMMLSKEFTRNSNVKWLHILDKITQTYNQSKHRTINMKPCNVVGKKIEKRLLDTVYTNMKIAGLAKYKVGDTVRISNQKTAFEKGYTRNWSTEIFDIIKVKITNPVTYLLKDYRNHPITGAFYEEEILKTKHRNIYLIERIIKRKESKLYVKWLGFDNTHNSWVNAKDVFSHKTEKK